MRLRSTETEGDSRVPVAGAFIAIGLTQYRHLQPSPAEMDSGYIVTRGGRHGMATQTSVPGVFAAGRRCRTDLPPG